MFTKQQVLEMLDDYAYDVLEQGRVGTCVSHTVKNLVKLNSKFSKKVKDLDVDFYDLYFRRTTRHLGKDAGMFPDVALNKVMQEGITVYGIVPEVFEPQDLSLNLPPYVNRFRIKPIKDFTTYYDKNFIQRLEEDFLENGLRAHQISIASAENWWTGEYPQSSGRILGGHSLVVINTPFVENGIRYLPVVDSAYSKRRVWSFKKGWRWASEQVLKDLVRSYRLVDFVWQDLKPQFEIPRRFLPLTYTTVSYGMRNSVNVKLLQDFLIYFGFIIPSGTTGNFFNETKTALAKWQNKYLPKRRDGKLYTGNYWGPISQAKLKQMFIKYSK